MRCRYQKTTSVSLVAVLQRFILLIVLLLSFLPIDCVRADTVVRVVETWPPGNYVTLGKNQYFYLRLAFGGIRQHRGDDRVVFRAQVLWSETVRRCFITFMPRRAWPDLRTEPADSVGSLAAPMFRLMRSAVLEGF